MPSMPLNVEDTVWLVNNFCANIVHRLVRDRGKQTTQPMTDIRARREAATGEEYQIEQGISQCFPGVMTRKRTEALAW